jgi:hypothetical protein
MRVEGLGAWLSKMPAYHKVLGVSLSNNNKKKTRVGRGREREAGRKRGRKIDYNCLHYLLGPEFLDPSVVAPVPGTFKVLNKYLIN